MPRIVHPSCLLYVAWTEFHLSRPRRSRSAPHDPKLPGIRAHSCSSAGRSSALSTTFPSTRRTRPR